MAILLREEDFRAIRVGEMVTDVVYLEAPENVLPVAYPKTDMPIYDLSPGMARAHHGPKRRSERFPALGSSLRTGKVTRYHVE